MSTRKARLPSHAELATFLETFLPPQSNVTDVPFLYHSPRHPLYSPTNSTTSRVILSITPTPGFYKAVNKPGPAPVCFLHRPWTLDRRNVRRGSLVLACHESFDAHLTVGWNVELGRRLGARLEDAICLQGYKGDPERKIGLVARLNEPTTLSAIVSKIRAEFDGTGDVFPASANGEHSIDESTNKEADVLAIMNAFHAEEVERVLEAAYSTSWIGDVKDGSRVLYLTGAAREYGIEAIKTVGMSAICVGHRPCEEWGIRFLAEETRKRWPEIEVIEVLEEEEPPPVRKQARDAEEASSTKLKEQNVEMN